MGRPIGNQMTRETGNLCYHWCRGGKGHYWAHAVKNTATVIDKFYKACDEHRRAERQEKQT